MTDAAGDSSGAPGRSRDPRTEADLRFLRSQQHSVGIFLDLDGTLADIVARPELGRPLPEVPALLADLSSRFGLVAVVTGRPTAEARSLLGAAGRRVDVFGLYGLEARDRSAGDLGDVREGVRSIVARVPGSRVEDKGLSLAVHYRGSPRPDVAAVELANALIPLAERSGLVVLPGKMVLELAPAGTPGKGWVVAHACKDRHLRGCLYAGDDLADLDAFIALDALRADGMVTVKVAVASDGTPPALTDDADVVVDRPAGLVSFLRGAVA